VAAAVVGHGGDVAEEFSLPFVCLLRIRRLIARHVSLVLQAIAFRDAVGPKRLDVPDRDGLRWFAQQEHSPSLALA
jgi:hypothetical protein